MAKPMSKLTVQNHRAHSLRVVLNESGEEELLSGGEAALVFASGHGSQTPTFTIVATDDSIEVFTADSDSVSLFKLPIGSRKKHGTEPSGIFRSGLGWSAPTILIPTVKLARGDGSIPMVSTSGR